MLLSVLVLLDKCKGQFLLQRFTSSTFNFSDKIVACFIHRLIIIFNNNQGDYVVLAGEKHCNGTI